MKKKFRDVYLIGISFIAGVLFIIQCGGGAGSIAETVSNALGISFDNSTSQISATTVQGAIDELATAIPFVYDAAGNKIGVFLSDPKRDSWKIWDISSHVPFTVEPATGEIIGFSADADEVESLYFTSSDCTGAGYLLLSSQVSGTSVATQIGDKLYWYEFGGETVAGSLIRSAKDYNGNCSALPENYFALKKAISDEDTKNAFVQAREITNPDYQGPLFIK